jgi:hypothetical protein
MMFSIKYLQFKPKNLGKCVFELEPKTPDTFQKFSSHFMVFAKISLLESYRSSHTVFFPKN